MGRIYPHNQGGVFKGYIADLGIQPNSGSPGRRLKKFFKTMPAAQAYIDSFTVAPTLANAVADNQVEIMHCLSRLRAVDATFTQATEFFLAHGARKGNPEISIVIETLLKNKTEAKRKQNYIYSLRKHLDKFAAFVGKKTKIGEITSEQIREFIYKENGHVNGVTQANLIRNISVLFNFSIKHNYLGINPVLKVEPPNILSHVPDLLTAADFQTLLDRCYKKKWHDRLTVFVLVGFCGVRTSEACNMSWSDINFQTKRVTIPAKVAKRGRHRINKIKDNAMEWLNLVRDERKKGRIIGDNWTSLLRTAVKFAHIDHTKNSIRHSFCSYAYASNWPIEEIVAYMGHNDSKLIHKNYRNLASTLDSGKWWHIYPPYYERDKALKDCTAENIERAVNSNQQFARETKTRFDVNHCREEMTTMFKQAIEQGELEARKRLDKIT